MGQIWKNWERWLRFQRLRLEGYTISWSRISSVSLAYQSRRNSLRLKFWCFLGSRECSSFFIKSSDNCLLRDLAELQISSLSLYSAFDRIIFSLFVYVNPEDNLSKEIVIECVQEDLLRDLRGKHEKGGLNGFIGGFGFVGDTRSSILVTLYNRCLITFLRGLRTLRHHIWPGNLRSL